MSARAGRDELGEQLRLLPVFVPGARLAEAPNLLLQKVPAPAFRLETSVELASTLGRIRAGLVVAGDSNAALALEATPTGVSVTLRVDDGVLDRLELPASRPVRARLEFAPDGPCTFAVASGTGEFVGLKGSFQAKPGCWIGTKVGVFALALDATPTAAHADFDYFRFSAP